MTRVLRINSCEECPFCYEQGGMYPTDRSPYYMCKEKDKEIPEEWKIPRWRTLPSLVGNKVRVSSKKEEKVS